MARPMLTAATNPVPQCAAVLGGDVVFGCEHWLVRWTPGSTKIVAVAALDGRVSAIAAAPDAVWVGTEAGRIYSYSSELQAFDDLERAVTCIDVRGSTVAAGCIDGNVYVYANAKKDARRVLEIKGYALCIALSDDLVFVGGTAWKIYVFTLDTLQSAILEGHENWVRSFSIKTDTDGSLLLASGSQERYIRLWRLTKSSSEDEAELFTTKYTVGEYSIVFEALLMGHDDWVVSVAWDTQSDALLSASADSSLIVWESEDSELWTPAFRLGDVSTWGASTATGTSGGFWQCLWLPDSVATVTRTGSWRVWSRDGWSPVPGISGHFKAVTDACWMENGCLLTTSLDQTTRLWYADESDVWELGRPQIHGYDMIACCPINGTAFASAGDEKVIRVFEMPKQVARQVSKVSKQEDVCLDLDTLPDIAGVPALGLSNKPDTEEASDIDLPAHPREDHLQRLTLWPEIEKMYGHGYEINTLTYSARHNVIASCSKANSEKHGKIRFFSTGTWHEVEPAVSGHQLTVTRLRASPNGERVLSVSRDRMWMLTNVKTHAVEVIKPKAHTRIIWDAAWLDDNTFVTVSRDKTLKVWNSQGDLQHSQSFDVPLTAVDCSFDGDYIVVGDEAGTISSIQVAATGLCAPEVVLKVAGRTNRVSFHPYDRHRVAVASEMVNIFNL